MALGIGEYEFALRHLGRLGNVKRAAFVNFLSLQYRHVLNAEGRLDIRLPQGSPIIGDLELFDRFEVFFKNDTLGIPWTYDFGSILRADYWDADNDALDFYRLVCFEYIHMLRFRQVLWPSDVLLRGRFEGTVAETAMKTLVNYNAGAAATAANGRIRTGDLALAQGWTVTTAGDQGRGVPIYRYFNNGNLLEILGGTLAVDASADISLTKAGRNNFVFEYHPIQLGENKTTGANKIIFDTRLGNLAVPESGVNRIDERTVIVVGGQGSGSERPYEVVEGPEYSTVNDIEFFLAAADEYESAGLQLVGAAEAEEKRAEQSFDFQVLQTPSTFYSPVSILGKKTYKLGDTVVAIGRNSSLQNRKITAVEIEVNNQGNTPKAEFSIETEEF